MSPLPTASPPPPINHLLRPPPAHLLRRLRLRPLPAHLLWRLRPPDMVPPAAAAPDSQVTAPASPTTERGDTARRDQSQSTDHMPVTMLEEPARSSTESSAASSGLDLEDTACHTRFSVENRMHLICVPGSQFHTYDRLVSVISQNITQNVQKRVINFYYTHDGRHEGLYTNNDNYEDATPSSSSRGF
jgi:hypothetical protein